MAKKNTSKSNIEFKFEGKNGNEFSGRIYEKKETEKSEMYPLSLTINGLAIVGSKLFISDKGTFVSMPNYKGSDGEYHSICYFYDKKDIEDLNALAEHIESLL